MFIIILFICFVVFLSIFCVILLFGLSFRICLVILNVFLFEIIGLGIVWSNNICNKFFILFLLVSFMEEFVW